MQPSVPPVSHEATKYSQSKRGCTTSCIVIHCEHIRYILILDLVRFLLSLSAGRSLLGLVDLLLLLVLARQYLSPPEILRLIHVLPPSGRHRREGHR